jgi:cardiolipin synthase
MLALLVSLALASDPCALSPRVSAQLDRRTASVARDGNAATLLVDGAASWPRRQALAASADVILVKTFIWTNDEIGRAAAQLLADRARAGATVIVQYDFVGSTPAADWIAAWETGPSAWVRTAEPFKTMADAGVTMLPTGFPGGPRRKTPTRIYAYDHEKYWITGERQADGTLRYTAITGGLNIASEYMYGATSAVDAGTGRGGWRDTDVELRGPIVEDMVARYLDLLEGLAPKNVSAFDRGAYLSPQPVAGAARARFVWTHPVVGKRHRIERLYRSMLQATPAGEPIVVETAYFAPAPRTLGALRRAARGGRPLTVISNSGSSVDVPFVVQASEIAFDSIARAAPDARFLHWVPSPGMETLHSKFASFGACGPVIIGSANLDGLSAEHNSEAVVLIEDQAFREEVAATLLADLSPERVQEIRSNPPKFFLVRWWHGLVYAVGWYVL